MQNLEDRGVTRVYLAGNLLDCAAIGSCREAGHPEWPIEEQTDLAAQAFSRHPLLEFWGIAGKADQSFLQENEVRPLALLEKKADNFRNLGDLRADVIHHGLRIRLLQGDSTSYPSQIYLHDYIRGVEEHKLIEEPHILLLGQFYPYCQGKDHGVMIFEPGGFHEYYARRGASGSSGAFHIQVRYQDSAISESYAGYVRPPERLGENGMAFVRTEAIH
jgi:hypothetical protein